LALASITMRLILIIITLLGAIISAYALSADTHLEIGLADMLQILYPADNPKTHFILPLKIDSDLTRQFDAVTFGHHRDAFIISGIGGCIFILGFTGLIIERKRNAKQMLANKSLATAAAPASCD
jgi:hypothetical protein